MSETLDGLQELDDLWCPGESSSHKHSGVAFGRNTAGNFNTRRLQTYSPEYAKQLALRIFRTAKRLSVSGVGPTGPLRVGEQVTRTTQYGFRHRGDDTNAVSLLNEDVTTARHVLTSINRRPISTSMMCYVFLHHKQVQFMRTI